MTLVSSASVSSFWGGMGVVLSGFCLYSLPYFIIQASESVCVSMMVDCSKEGYKLATPVPSAPWHGAQECSYMRPPCGLMSLLHENIR